MWAARAPGHLPCLLHTLSFCHLILTRFWNHAVVGNTRGPDQLTACERHQTRRRRGSRSQVGRVKFSPHSQVNAEAGQLSGWGFLGGMGTQQAVPRQCCQKGQLDHCSDPGSWQWPQERNPEGQTCIFDATLNARPL